MQKVALKQVILLATTGVLVLFQILSLALPNWTKVNSFYGGIFRFCFEGSNSATCCTNVEDWKDVLLFVDLNLSESFTFSLFFFLLLWIFILDAYRAVRAFMIIGLLFLLVNIISIILFVSVLSSQPEMRKKIGLAASYGIAGN